MPDQMSVSEFITETNEDYKSPTTSNFTTRLSQCRSTVTAIEETFLSQTLPLCPSNAATVPIKRCHCAHQTLPLCPSNAATVPIKRSHCAH
ncbi:hypothetical protein AB205_0045180 [Aquarana catesbeiana]|uniref:Uncharacterized protein n=1 Tax=Aquarana catesbeiana TaxID=8400 RepID=A0A2G9QI54_AQUCT|nr:hypothetical protein AB205_0045180 [Aquarana catesbeiana]